MSKDLSLGRLTFIYTVGNFTSKIITLLLFFVYTYYLDEKTIGYFDLIITTIGWLIPIISLQISDSVLRWTISEDKEFVKIVTGSAVVVLINSLIFLLIYVLICSFLNFQFKIQIFIFIISQTIYPIVLQFARGSGNNKIYVIAGIFYSILYTALSLMALIVLKMNLEGLITANILAAFFTILYISYKVQLNKYLKFKDIDIPFTMDMIRYSLPLIPNTLSWWAISTIDRYVVLYYLGASSNGIFAVGMKFPTILLMFTNIFSMAWQERGIKTFNSLDKDTYYTKTFDNYFTILFSTIFLLISITKPVILYIVPSNYFEIWKFVPILYLAVGFQALSAFYGIGYIASKDTKGALFTTIYGTVVTIILNFLLVPKLGLIGSSIAMSAGYLAMFITRVYKTKMFFKIDLPVIKMFSLFSLCLLFGVLTTSGNIYVLFVCPLAAFILFIYYNISFLQKMFVQLNIGPKFNLK